MIYHSSSNALVAFNFTLEEDDIDGALVLGETPLPSMGSTPSNTHRKNPSLRIFRCFRRNIALNNMYSITHHPSMGSKPVEDLCDEKHWMQYSSYQKKQRDWGIMRGIKVVRIATISPLRISDRFGEALTR